MAVHFEHNFADGTGIRIVDVPDETIKRQVVEIQFRVSAQGQKPRLAKCPLYDKDTQTDLFPELLDAILQSKIKEIGRKCEKCGENFLPSSPRQLQCFDCKDDKKETE